MMGRANGSQSIPGEKHENCSREYKIKVAYLPSYLLNNLTVSEQASHRKGKDHFFQKLTSSIKSEGIRNSVLVEGGRIRRSHRHKADDYQLENEKSLFFVTQLGGSRTWVAQQLGILVPCVISDFEDLIDVPEVTRQYASRHLPDLPENKSLVDNKWGLTGPTLKHIHLDNK